MYETLRKNLDWIAEKGKEVADLLNIKFEKLRYRRIYDKKPCLKLMFWDGERKFDISIFPSEGDGEGEVLFFPDGCQEDRRGGQKLPNLFRVCILEELAVKLRHRFQKDADDLLQIADFLRPKELKLSKEVPKQRVSYVLL